MTIVADCFEVFDLKKHALTAVKLLVLGLIVFWVFKTFDRSHWDNLVSQPKHWGWLVVSFVVVLLAHVISFWRWSVFVHALGVPFSTFEAVRLGFVGALFNFVSLGAVGGDLFKALAAAKQAPGKRPEVVASVLVDRALGLLGLVIVAAVSLQFFGSTLSPTLDWIRRGAWLFTFVGVGALGLVAFVGHHLPTKLLLRVPFVGDLAYRMASAGMLFEGRPRLVVELLGMSCLVHALLTLGMFIVSTSLYSNTPSLREHFLTVPPAFAAAALPIAPGGLGVQEMAVAKLFEELPSIPSSFSGLVVAIVFRVEIIAIAAIGGVLYLLGARELKALEELQA